MDMKIAYTKHAMVPLEERGIEKGMLRELLKHPQQVVKAVAGKEIAYDIFKRGVEDFLFRVIYTRKGSDLKVTTAYWTSKIVKHWEGER
jgi:hypothetical protein